MFLGTLLMLLPITHAASACAPKVHVHLSGPLSAAPGSSVEYHIVVHNTGCGAATELSLVDVLPPGVRYLGARPAPTAVQQGDAGASEVRWTGLLIDAMTSQGFDVEAQVVAGAGVLTDSACETHPAMGSASCATQHTKVLTDDPTPHASCGEGAHTGHGHGEHGGHGHGSGDGLGTCECPNGLPCTLDVSNACDLTIGADQAPPRSTIMLTGSAVHRCTPVVDAAGNIVAGQGLRIEAPNVTVDLNGHGIHSAVDATRVVGAGPLTENTGLAVAARNVRVVNSDLTAVSGIDGFTTNVDFSATAGGELRGALIGGERSNLEISGDHGGGGVRAERAASFTIDSVKVTSLNREAGAAIRLARAQDLEIRSSSIEGSAGGVELHTASRVRIKDNPVISGGGAEGIRLEHDVTGAVITGNIVQDSQANGITVGWSSRDIRIERNVIQRNRGYGVCVSQWGTSEIVTGPNSFHSNGEGDIGSVARAPMAATALQ